jgi:hypothetical protein
MHKALNAALCSIRTEQKCLSDRLERALALNGDALFNKVVKIVGEEDMYISLYNKTSVSKGLYDVQGFKDRRVKTMLAKIDALRDWDVETIDRLEYSSRMFCFRSPVMSIHITVYLADDAKNCKRVVVGEETKIVPKYEFRCS